MIYRLTFPSTDWRNISCRAYFSPPQASTSIQARRYSSRQAQSARSCRVRLGFYVNSVRLVRLTVGWRTLSLEQLAYHHSIRFVRRIHTRIHRRSSLAEGRGHGSAKHLPSAYCVCWLCSIHWHRIIAGRVRVLSSSLVPGYPRYDMIS